MSAVRRLSRVDLISADPRRLAMFYEALGFTPRPPAPLGAGQEIRVALGLGNERIDVFRPSRFGAPYPALVPGWSTSFQHFAIVVSDMRQAYARLQAQAGWAAISTDGPQRLPERSGGVTAFKFRDPEGHPLEFIAFPPTHARWSQSGHVGIFLGIDHSAVSVSDTHRSTVFYQGLGLRRTGGSTNVGLEQSLLDDLPEAHVAVTALSTPLNPTPHVELLCYRGDFIRDTHPPSPDDVAASRLVFEADAAGETPSSSMIRDPDGHIIMVEDARAYSGST